MALTPIEINLKKIALSLGILQGLAYSIMGLICIVMYNQKMRILVSSSYIETINSNIYYLFLSPENVIDFQNYTLHPKTFTAFAWIYFILHIVWAGISVDAFRHKGMSLAKRLIMWSYITIFVSIWDFITVCMLGADYKKCLDWSANNIGYQGACATGFLPVLVIAARGFVLWLVNVIFAVVVHKIAARLKKAENSYEHDFAPTTPPPVSMPIGFQPYYPTSPSITPQQSDPNTGRSPLSPSSYSMFEYPANGNYPNGQQHPPYYKRQ